MALPPASERRISPVLEVKLTHAMTSQDIDKIAMVTGGIIEGSTSNARVYYGGHERGLPHGISYPEFGAEIDFVGGPISAVMEAPQAFLKVDKNDICLNNSAVILREDSVTFVRRPEMEADGPFEPTANVSMVTIAKDGITYQKTRVSAIRDESILRVVEMIDDAYRAIAARRG